MAGDGALHALAPDAEEHGAEEHDVEVELDGGDGASVAEGVEAMAWEPSHRHG